MAEKEIEIEVEEKETGSNTLLYIYQQLTKKGYNIEYNNEAIIKFIQPVAKRLWSLSTLVDDAEECCVKKCQQFPNVFGISVNRCGPGECCIFPTCLQHALTKETIALRDYASLTRVPKRFLHRNLETLPSIEYARLMSLQRNFNKITTLSNINELCSK